MALRLYVSFVLLAAQVNGGILDLRIPTHEHPNWRTKNDYLIKFEYVPPGHNSSSAVLNSCAQTSLPENSVCSGRGKCVHWHDNVKISKLSFCECDLFWADPECRTARKSQMQAYLLSVLFGMLGFDQFYLGNIAAGLSKFCTLGGFGVWYVYDVVRIGSTPIMVTEHYRLAKDLPHWLFFLTVVAWFTFIGFFFGIRSISSQRRQKARDELILRAEQAAMESNWPTAMEHYDYGATAYSSRGAHGLG